MSLEREIERLLAVDHSPEFVAKVRQRIAVDPPAAAGWWSWKLAPIGAGVAAATIGAILWSPSEPVGVLPASRTMVKEAPAMVSRAVAPPRALATARVSPRPLVPLPSVLAPLPDVLLSGDESRAFDLLLARVQEGSLPDMQDSRAAVDAMGPSWIHIAPVTIDPIAQAEGE